MDRFRATRRTYIHGGIPQDRSIPNDYPSSNINRVWTNIDLPPRRPRVARRNSSDSSIDRLVRGFLRSFSYFVFFLLEYFCIRSTNSPKSILLRDPLRAAPRDRCICDREKGEYVVALDDEVPFLSNELKSIRGETWTRFIIILKLRVALNLLNS